MIHTLGDHLPPSAATPRVLALDATAAERLFERAAVTLADLSVHGQLPYADAAFDAVAAYDPALGRWINEIRRVLRPGGRLLLMAVARPDRAVGWRAGLVAGGWIHVYSTDDLGEGVLVRGERPPEVSDTVARIAAVAARDEGVHGVRLTPATDDLSAVGRYVFLLVVQTPNKPVWQLAEGEMPEWRAVRVADGSKRAVVLAFGSLVKAVQFMQVAVLAGWLDGVNKVAKFPPEVARGWDFDLWVGPSLDAVRGWRPVADVWVDYSQAIHGEG